MSKAKKNKPAGEKRSGFCMYIGPTIIGVIQQGRIVHGDRQEALLQLARETEAYPMIKTLVIPGDKLPDARVKVKTPGNLLYVNYRQLAAGSRKTKEE